MGLSEPLTHYEALKFYEQEYDNGIKSGEFFPFVYPIGSFGVAVLLAFLLIPPTNYSRHILARFTTFMIICGSSIYTICYLKCRSPSLSFGIGMASVWLMIWSATLLIFHDVKRDFKRLQAVSSASTLDSNGSMTDNPNVHLRSKPTNANSLLRRRHPGTSSDLKTSPYPTTRYYFSWQYWPHHPFRERFIWVIDLVCSSRGVGWNWMLQGLPSYPPTVLAQAEGKPEEEMKLQDQSISYTGIKRFSEKKEFLVHNIILTVPSYLLLDLLKTTMNHDPYFWGLISEPPPPYFPEIFHSSSAMLRCYRISVVVAIVGTFISFCSSLSALVYVGVLGTDLIGAQAELWYFPDAWGSFSNVLNKGLAGWWGGWWHQTFGYAFRTAGTWVMATLGITQSSSISGKAVQLFTAFGLSGILHAGGSITQLGHSNPFSGVFLFFILQPVGIMLQMYLAAQLRQSDVHERIPIRVRQATNFIYVHVWFYLTGSLLCDDWVKSGMLLFEPVPFSPLRSLGFGVEGDGFWCLGGGQWAHWYTGKYWWSSGIAF